MYTDKHFPPTFLSKNPSLRDMVKDQTDYDHRISSISSNFKKESETTSYQQSSVRSRFEKLDRSNIHSQSFGSTDPMQRSKIVERGYPIDLRIGEERAIRASQRRAMRQTPTKQIEQSLRVRPSTPNILFSSTHRDEYPVEETRSPIYFPPLSYGRCTPSRDLFRSTDDTNSNTTFNLHRPSDYYR